MHPVWLVSGRRGRLRALRLDDVPASGPGSTGCDARALARVVASPHGLLLGRANLTSVEASEASAAPLDFASDTLAAPPAGEPGRSQPVRTLDEVSDPEREDSIPLGLTPDGGQRDGYLQPNRSEDAQRPRDN